MPPPERVRLPTGTPGLDWMITDDGSRTLWDQEVRETYHSGCGAVAESLGVYLLNSGVANRLRAGKATSVLEYGLGTATAFLLTASVADFAQVPLRYAALENVFLPAEVFESLQLVKSLSDRATQTAGGAEARPEHEFDWDCLNSVGTLLHGLTAARRHLPRDPEPGEYVFELGDYVTLTVQIGDARDFRCDSPSASALAPLDAIYFDAFSPDTSPELWTREVFEQAFGALRAGGTLTSYCVKSAVRRTLRDVGFDVRRVPGPVGGKREVLLAVK